MSAKDVPAPIDCALHDYVEIACLFRYHVAITMRDAERVTGTAKTTETLSDKTEVLHLLTSDGLRRLPLHDLQRLQVLTENARFESVDFT